VVPLWRIESPIELPVLRIVLDPRELILDLFQGRHEHVVGLSEAFKWTLTRKSPKEFLETDLSGRR
jgi:hypothetical protein